MSWGSHPYLKKEIIIYDYPTLNEAHSGVLADAPMATLKGGNLRKKTSLYEIYPPSHRPPQTTLADQTMAVLRDLLHRPPRGHVGRPQSCG